MDISIEHIETSVVMSENIYLGLLSSTYFFDIFLQLITFCILFVNLQLLGVSDYVLLTWNFLTSSRPNMPKSNS